MEQLRVGKRVVHDGATEGALVFELRDPSDDRGAKHGGGRVDVGSLHAEDADAFRDRRVHDRGNRDARFFGHGPYIARF